MYQKRVLVVNGANMDLLGKRDVGALGSETLEVIMQELEEYSRSLEVEISCFQSNMEGEVINILHGSGERYDAVIINPGSFGHYSIGIKEALEAVHVPCIEVHLANFFRKQENKSVLVSACNGVVCGFGRGSYKVALDGIIKMMK